MTKVAWANEMQKLAKEQPHPDWLLLRYQAQISSPDAASGPQWRHAVRAGMRRNFPTICHDDHAQPVR